MRQVVFHQPLEVYLPELVMVHPRLEDFYYAGQLYIDIYSMKEPLVIQQLNGHPDSEFGLIAGQRKNYLIMTKLKPGIEIPAYGYSSSLEKVAEKEIQALKKNFQKKEKSQFI